ncbi:hypothetical protein ABPG72_019296 [Tetrahymena utriculariae]
MQLNQPPQQGVPQGPSINNQQEYFEFQKASYLIYTVFPFDIAKGLEIEEQLKIKIFFSQKKKFLEECYCDTQPRIKGKQNNQLSVKNLDILLNLRVYCHHEKPWNCHCSNNCENETTQYFIIPDFQSEYIYFFINAQDSFYKELTINFELFFNQSFSSDNSRIKVVVQTTCKGNEVLNLEIRDKNLEISSILDNARCFLVFKNENLTNLNKEHMIEDQCLILIVEIVKWKLIEFFKIIISDCG